VDDKDVSALDAKAVGKMLRGPVGTSVRIKVQKRDGTTPRAYDVTLRRAAPKVKLPLQTTLPLHRSRY
jgi:C-terminal processing protease CtpA/Prc